MALKAPLRYDFDLVRMDEGLRLKSEALPISIYSKHDPQTRLLERLIPMVRRHVRQARGIGAKRVGLVVKGARVSCYVYPV